MFPLALAALPRKQPVKMPEDVGTQEPHGMALSAQSEFRQLDQPAPVKRYQEILSPRECARFVRLRIPSAAHMLRRQPPDRSQGPSFPKGRGVQFKGPLPSIATMPSAITKWIGTVAQRSRMLSWMPFQCRVFFGQAGAGALYKPLAAPTGYLCAWRAGNVLLGCE